MSESACLPDLEKSVKGKIRRDAVLADSNWFRVGGKADILFRPEDANDLAACFAALPADFPVTIIGVGSNIIVRDGGIRGLVVRLGRGFTAMENKSSDYTDTRPGGRVSLEHSHNAKSGDFAGGRIIVSCGAGALGRNLAWWCQENGMTGLEFLSGIPGTVGGAVAMNAGAYGDEVVNHLVAAELVLRDGRIINCPVEDLAMSYRHTILPAGAVVTKAVFAVSHGDKEKIAARINEIAGSREATQPIRERTGGSTFKNPPDKKAWQLIDEAGCRGLKKGGAQISELHCNFMINTGDAVAADLERLGEEVRARVKAKSGVELEWEIKRIGDE